jgi:hypothetical protein
MAIGSIRFARDSANGVIAIRSRPHRNEPRLVVSTRAFAETGTLHDFQERIDMRIDALLPAATCLAMLALLPRAGGSQERPAGSLDPPTAQLGIELPTLGGAKWGATRREYVNPATMKDIRDNLHATYVRTGWIPGRLNFEKIRWYREDNGMDIICSSGLWMMIIIPSLKDDRKGEQDLVDNVREFFARYTVREFGCIRYAEIVNEADLRANGFADVREYASYYQRVAPTIASFGVDVITSGVSGEDRPWTAGLAAILTDAKANAPISGYGFHPYGVPPSRMADATLAMREAAGVLPNGTLPDVFVTEIGQPNASDLYQTIVNLAHATPTITIYEYRAQPGEDAQYGLKNHPALYKAVQSAWEYVQSRPEHDVSSGH